MVTAGLGGMGGAQPLAVTLNEGCALCVEVDLQRIERRIETAYLDERAGSLDDALSRLDAARGEGRALSIGLLGNAAEVLPELAARGVEIDVVTDQTSAHDPLNGYVPAGPDRRAGRRAARLRPGRLPRPRRAERARARGGDPPAPAGRRRGVRLRQRAARPGRRARRRERVQLPRLRPRLHPAAVLRGQGPVPLGRAVRRPGRHRRHRRRDPRPVRRAGPHPRAGSSWRASASASRACRRGSAGSATASGTWPACASTSWWRAAPCAGRS